MPYKDEDLISLKHLCNILLKEVNSESLQNLPMDIYSRVAVHIETLKAIPKEIEAEEEITHEQIELLSNAIKLLFEARYSKIEALTNQEYVASEKKHGSDKIDYSKLTGEEKFILDGSLEAKKRIEMVFEAILGGRPIVLEKITNMQSRKLIPVRFLKPIDRFMGIDMETYGPYLEDDIALLPSENARALTQNGFVEQIQTLDP